MRLALLFRSPVALVVTSVVAVAGCEQRRTATGDVQAPYEDGNVTVIGTDTDGTLVAGSTPPLNAGDCVVVGDNCVAPDPSGHFCERDGGPVDVIVIDGEVVETICYPPPAEGSPTVVVDADSDGDLDIDQSANNTTVTFDKATDGTEVEGNITVDGNNVAIYGNGIDKTIVHGDILLAGNNVRLRGMTIDGDLLLTSNGVAAVFVRVLGNVIIEGENDVFSGSDVFGELQCTPNNVTLVGNRVQGGFTATGNNPECVGNRAFEDENQDELVDDEEIGDPVVCGD